MNKKQVTKYLLFMYVLAYALEIAASIVLLKDPDGNGRIRSQVIMMVVMYVPFFATLFARGNLKGIGFKPKFKGCGYLIPVCLFAPALTAILGAVLFFSVFPDMFDFTGSYLQANLPAGMDLTAELEKKGLTYSLYTVITIAASVTYAPVINMFLALGEEVGWRGFLYPELKKSMGSLPAWLLGGFIWGSFHFPYMILAGYEYGKEYFGFPVLGPVVFSLWAIALGLIHEIVYDKTKCIWYPALLHGAVNAYTFAGLFYNMNDVEKAGKLLILGPFMNGIIAGIPVLLVAVILAATVLKKKKAEA